MNAGTSAFLEFGHELIVDLFAGGGGASLGIEQAFGRSPACGNSVCPPMARALVASNLADLIEFYSRAAA